MSNVDRYAVVGHPVEHSQSPFIHAMFAGQTGQSIDYGRVLSPLDGFSDTVRAFAASGARGCNVTVPFKFEAFELGARHTPRAGLARAANTLRFDAESEGGWQADNTDGIALVRDIERNAGVALAARRVLLIGAGGASSGVLGPLIEAGPAVIVVANRTALRAHELVERHLELAGRHGADLRAASLDDCGKDFDIVLNASASSLQGAASPVHAEVLAPGALAVDLMYGPAAEGFLAWARQRGAVGRDGLGMLVEQAAEAFFVWRGVRPDTAPVLVALRERLTSKTA